MNCHRNLFRFLKEAWLPFSKYLFVFIPMCNVRTLFLITVLLTTSKRVGLDQFVNWKSLCILFDFFTRCYAMRIKWNWSLIYILFYISFIYLCPSRSCCFVIIVLHFVHFWWIWNIQSVFSISFWHIFWRRAIKLLLFSNCYLVN